MVSLKGFKDWLRMRKQEMQLQSVAIGMNSTIDWEDSHIVMLDYDLEDIEKVTESVRELQEFYKLADAEVFKTRNGFHVFFWYDHVPYERLKQIIDFARYVDPMYKYISRYYDHKTIRVAGKYQEKDIEYACAVKSYFAQPRSKRKDVLEIGDMKRKEHAVMRGKENE